MATIAVASSSLIVIRGHQPRRKVVYGNERVLDTRERKKEITSGENSAFSGPSVCVWETVSP